MNHINEDSLLKYALDIIDDEKEYSEIESHLAICPECRAELDNIRSDMDIIGNINAPRIDLDSPLRRPQHNVLYPIVRAAALIIFGIVIGYGAANLQSRELVSVSPSYAILAPAPDSLVGLAVSDATEITLK